MSIHHCDEADCCYTGQPSPSACGCHKTDEQMLRESHAGLLAALRNLAAQCGAMQAFEHEVCDAIGNTNWACIADAIAAADVAIAKAERATS